MVERRLKGEAVDGLSVDDVRTGADEEGPPAVPSVSVKTVGGRSIALDGLRGKVVLVEIWATWCPPCRGTLEWLDKLQRAHPDRLAVVALAVDSPEAEVRRLIGELKPSYEAAIAGPDVMAPFGAVAAVPKMFIFDSDGKRARVFYGAPPDQHQKVEKALSELGLTRTP
jgi:thiol-disulfide isomerase/thioredoxin